MIDTIILACIGIILFAGIAKLRIDLGTINENLMEAALRHEATLVQVKDEVVYLHQDLQDEIKKALGGTL